MRSLGEALSKVTLQLRAPDKFERSFCRTIIVERDLLVPGKKRR